MDASAMDKVRLSTPQTKTVRALALGHPQPVEELTSPARLFDACHLPFQSVVKQRDLLWAAHLFVWLECCR